MNLGGLLGVLLTAASTMPPGGGIVLAATDAPPPGASSCSGCHGTASPIAGRDVHELTDKLNAFRSGMRGSTVMGRITKGFSAEELSAIAVWWAGRK
jgi:cytochrome subunit of sulfide dehydrogenase